jgi:predicted DCC family thiol-disulfide oxidoreductase YuxK
VRLAGAAKLRREPLEGSEADRYLSDVTPERRLARAWLVAPDGRRWAGDDAIWHALYLAPVLGLLLRPLRWLPGFSSISRRVYAWVATHRRQLGCRIDRH